MARDYITVTGTTENSQLLVSAVESIRQAEREIRKIRDRMVHSQDGEVYTDLESRFGITAGLGDDVFVLVDGAYQMLNGLGGNSGYLIDLTGRVGRE
jgi:hypothetical protein